MWTKDIGKVYPELKGLPPYEQNNILEKARHEVQKDGKSLFWGTRFVLLGVLIGVICGAITYLLSNGNDTMPLICSVTIVIAYIQMVTSRNIKMLRPKVKELVQDKI